MSPKANKITLYDVTTHQLRLVMRLYRHFSIPYAFSAAAQMQAVFKIESGSSSGINVVWTYTVIFLCSGTRVVSVIKILPG